VTEQECDGQKKAGRSGCPGFPVLATQDLVAADAFAAEATKPRFTGLQGKTAGFRTQNLRHPRA